MEPIGNHTNIRPSRPVPPKQLSVDYSDGVNSLMEVALLPQVDSVVSDCLTSGLGTPYTRFEGRISKSDSSQTETLEASRFNGHTGQRVEGQRIEVKSESTTEDGRRVTRGEVEGYQFESRSGFDPESGAFVNEGYIISGASGEQIDFHREIRPAADQNGSQFSGHIGGVPERGSIKMGPDGLSIERQVGDYHIAGKVTGTPPTPTMPGQ